MILHDFSLYTSLHLPGETRVTSVTYSTLIDFMLHVVTQNALFSLCIKKIPRNSLSRFITNTSPTKNLKYLQIIVILVLADGYHQGWLVCPTAKCGIGSLLSPILSHLLSGRKPRILVL